MRRTIAARCAWRTTVAAIAVMAALASCAPAPGVATRTGPPAAGPGSVPATGTASLPSAAAMQARGPNAARIAAAHADSLLGVWMPALSSPRIDSLGRPNWSPHARWSAAAAHARAVLRDAADSVTGWRALAAESSSVLRPYALRRVAGALLVRGDTVAADRDLGEVAKLESVWSWEALRTRCDLALGAAQPARAESLLDAAIGEGWSDLDHAALLMRRALLAEARGDSGTAASRAHEVLNGYPSSTPAVSAIALIERFATFRAIPVPLADGRQAAESARLRGDRVASIDWLERAHAAATGATRSRVDIQWSRALREARRFDAALAVTSTALHAKPAVALAAELRLERARCYRDSGRRSEALRAYAAVERDSLSDDLAAAAGWEHGLEWIAAGRNNEARLTLRRAAGRNGDRSADALLLCGLLWIADGEPQRALGEWGRADEQLEAFQFWRAVLSRQAADSSLRRAGGLTLAMLAARPGYAFYRVASRETLGVHGWPGALAVRDTCASVIPELALAEAIIVLGDTTAALQVVQRWRSDWIKQFGERAGMYPSGCRVFPLLDAAELAAGINQIPLAIRLAQNALEAPSRVNWQAGEWTLNVLPYPPALDTMYGAIPESLGTDPVDRALLRAIAWQESRFDPRARSRSDALGLYQLKVASAGDMARRRGEAPPDREALFDPATSLRYGREYLKWLLERFGNQWPVAVSAYNSGPSPVSPKWQEWLDRGGVALFCELIGRAETRDYVRNIMGARQAYHELRPYARHGGVTPGP